jgi:ATP-dependent Clp protease adaptor protein ClpS
VLLLNDDFTPMDFVILVLQKFFKKGPLEAEKVMLEVHHRGAGVAGVYSKEVAEMKVHQVDQFAKSHQHPLKCVMEVE